MLGIQTTIASARKAICLALAGATAVVCASSAQAQNCNAAVALSATPNDGRDDTSAIEAAMQRATNAGRSLVIPAGTYNLNRSTGINVKIRKTFTVRATGAKFVIGDRMEGDVFSIDTNGDSFRSATCGGTGKASVTWDGGEFDMRNMKVSTSVPINTLTTDRPTSSQATADAISIRGAADRNGTRTQKLNVATVRNVKVTGSNNSWRTAGGDSGVFISAATRALVEDSQFYGIRDAAIYLSADDKKTSLGGNYTVRDVTVERSYDGITSKRGADNIRYENNTITDTVVPLSIKALRNNLYAIGVTMTGNDLRRCVRCILVENANDATITNNNLFQVGDKVAGDNSPVNARGRQYEGIALEGTRGTNQVRNNRFGALTGSRAGSVTTWANVTRDFNGRPAGAIAKSGNSYTGSWDKREGP